MKWKVKGSAEKGEANRDYARGLDRVKQSVSEALVTEQVPPAYHDSIKKYFDSLSPPPQAADARGGKDE
jgi:hypothetical protein